MPGTPNPYHTDATPWNEAVGIPWSENSTRNLIAALEQGDNIEEIANYLQCSEETVRAKMGELGFVRRSPARSR